MDNIGCRQDRCCATSFQVFSAYFHLERGWVVAILAAANIVLAYFSKMAIKYHGRVCLCSVHASSALYAYMHSTMYF
jgi:hypothetical protein